MRTELSPYRVVWGRRLFVATMLKLGGTGFVAILERAGTLAPLGIVSVLLVVAMLWEAPA